MKLMDDMGSVILDVNQSFLIEIIQNMINNKGWKFFPSFFFVYTDIF